MFLLSLDDLSTTGFACRAIGSFCLGFLIPLTGTRQLYTVSSGQSHLPEGYTLKLLVLQVSVYNHHQRWGLYPADGIERLSHDAAGLCGIHAYEPVGFASCLGSQKEVVIVAVGMKIL